MRAPTKAAQYLFVYGTLRSFSQNQFARLLRQNSTLVGPATVCGRLYDLGSYPGLQLSSDEGDRVIGEVYRLNKPAETLRFLDDYEGCGSLDEPPYEFERIVTDVDAGGRAIKAWLYVYRGRVKDSHRIASGNYREGKAEYTFIRDAG